MMPTGTLIERSTPADDTDDASHNWDGINRRDPNVVLMRLGIVEKGLTAHVKHCATLQKGILATGLATLGWVVTHSPEVAGWLGRMIAKLGGA